MSGYHQTALVLTEMSRRNGELGFINVFERLVESFHLHPDLEGRVAKLVVDPASNQWTGSLPVFVAERSLRELIAENAWLRVTVDFLVAGTRHGGELYFYPTTPNAERVGLMLRLESSAYLAVYGGRPTYYGLFDQDAKDWLVAVCLGVTEAFGADGFIYDFEPTGLTQFGIPDIRKRLLHPVFDPEKGGGPGLIIGIKSNIVSRAELGVVWGAENIQETTSGYAFLALLRRDDQPSEWAQRQMADEE